MSMEHAVSHSHGTAQCRTDGLNPNPVVIRLITCQPDGGHQANEIHFASLIQGLVPWIVQAGARGRWWLFLPLSII